ncbi:MAG: succinate--CoA ligase subunit alpha [Chloroflexi bacterium]|nr:succinate--CoA ligase subunit alpha [Chloroflexota bacterium]
MSILVDASTRVLVQGATGRFGQIQTKLMLDYGTKIVAGVTPGKGGQEVLGVPIYDTIAEARTEHPFDASVIYVPAPYTLDAAVEAIESDIPLVVVITEGVPVHDAMKVRALAKERGSWVIGPNCPGIITPGQTSLGMYPPTCAMPGVVGVASRSGTLCFEVTKLMVEAGIGQTSCVGIGGDPVIGTNFVEYLKLFEEDPETRAVVMIGELGGNQEEHATRFIAEMTKPVIAFISGKTAPAEKRMGHAGAISSEGSGVAADKVKALEAAGVRMADTLNDIVRLTAEALGR